MKKQWFYLEAYTFFTVKNEKVLVYNTLDGSYIINSDKSVISLMEEMFNDKSGVVLLQYDYLNEAIEKFISSIRFKYMGDIIDVSLTERKPIQISPILNLQSDINKLKQNSEYKIVEEALHYLNSVTFYINSFCTLNCPFCSLAYKQFSMCTTHNDSVELELANIIEIIQDKSLINLNSISITGGNILHYSKYKQLIYFLKDSNKHIDWFFYYKNIINSISDLPSSGNFTINIIIDSSIDLIVFKTLYSNLKKTKIDYYFYFLIQSENDCVFFENISLENTDNNKYNFRLLYNKKNLSFFEQHGYSIKEDILIEKLSLREIYSHQVLNNNDFGKLIIQPNGDVFANINTSQIGNINNDAIHDLISNEMLKGQSWLRIRNNESCNSCIYQWLCPSPSNYELILGRDNLCHIK